MDGLKYPKEHSSKVWSVQKFQRRNLKKLMDIDNRRYVDDRHIVMTFFAETLKV